MTATITNPELLRLFDRSIHGIKERRNTTIDKFKPTYDIFEN